jgi:hypothetical protein
MTALRENDGARTMLKKSVLTIAFLMPLVAVTATARAGSTISDKSYWPSEARRETLAGTGIARRDLNSAFAYDQGVQRFERTGAPITEESEWRYVGGPKAGYTVVRPSGR